jgi:hypothetical protein
MLSAELIAAITTCNLSELTTFLQDNSLGEVTACTLAASIGQLATLRYLREHNVPWDEETCWAAAEHGHFEVLNLEMVKWLDSCGLNIPATKYGSSFQFGSLELLQWAVEEKKHVLTAEHLMCAIKSCDIEMIQWLLTQNCACDDRHFVAAAIKRRLDILKMLPVSEVLSHDRVFYEVIHSGHIESVKWLHEQKCSYNLDELCYGAIISRNFEMLKLVRSYGATWTASHCALAAGYGELEMIKWMRAEGCPWDEQTCDRAALHGYKDVLTWSRENGCPWTCIARRQWLKR